MKFIFSSIIVFCTATVFSQNVLTPELMWKLKRLNGGSISSDERYVLFDLKSYEMSTNKGNNEIYVYDIKKDKIKQLTNTPFSEMEAQWGKNNTIWFLSTELDGLQVWKMNIDGEEKQKVSNFSGIELEGFKIAPDEKSIITIEAVKTRQTLQDKYPDLQLSNARIEEDLMYKHWDHYTDFNNRHLFIHEINDNKIESVGIDILKGENYDGILPPHGGTEQFCYSPNCKSIIYTSKKMKGKAFALSTNSDLYEYSISKKTTTNITEANKGYDVNPIFSHDESKMAWLAMSIEGNESAKNDIIVREISSGKDINITINNDVTVDQFQWHSSGKFIYYIAAIKGTKQIFEVNLETKEHRQVTSGKFDFVSLAVADDEIIAGQQSMIAPTDLFKVSLKKSKIKQVTEFNEEILKKIDKPTIEERWVETTDGKIMLVWMILPPKFDASKKYPALLYCQGGPQSPVSQFFSYRWNFMVMASQGYIVVAPNRRGLPGFGQEWNDAISKDWGGQPIKDYLSAIDNAANEPYVDETRMGAIGASYGGYSVYFLAGVHENRFKTFVSHCGLFNLESWYGTTEEMFFANNEIGGPYWDAKNKELYEKNSPHKMIDKWNTPILVIHGEEDYRVPESEGMQAFQAAQLKGIRSKYLHFPTEGHWVTSPQNGLVWYREFFEWLATDLKESKVK
jgi:dipeptidyl aminopeptidase/acylaminoacyl peptidase